MNGKCPMCGKRFRLESGLNVGDITYCTECEAELEVISLNPVKLDWPFIEEDLEYEYDDDYDDELDDWDD